LLDLHIAPQDLFGLRVIMFGEVQVQDMYGIPVIMQDHQDHVQSGFQDIGQEKDEDTIGCPVIGDINSLVFEICLHK
jgi:hypothetical protein